MSKTPNFTMKALALVIGSTALLSACGGSSGGSSGSGSTSFSVTDAPVDDVEIVKVTFSRIDLKPADDDAEVLSYEFDEPVTIDNLLALTGNDAEPILEGVDVPPGDYQWLRVYVDGGIPNSSVTPELGNETDLFIPGQQNGNANGQPRFLQLNTGFTVAAGSRSDFTIDFVLRKGLTKPANADHYLLRPAMRLLNNIEVGTISGSVAESVLNDPNCSPIDGNGSVYLYDGDLNAAEQTPDDYYDPEGNGTGDESTNRPIASAEVLQNDSGEYRFTIGFVAETEEGYSVAYTCEPGNDAPESDDDIAFTEVIAVDVIAGETSEVSFTEAPAAPIEEDLQETVEQLPESEQNPA